MKIIIKNEQETAKLAQDILPSFLERKIILLYGDLGSGKTTFTKYLAKALKIKNNVTSPTFNIMKRYKITDELIIKSTNAEYLVHIDAYRINGGGEEFLDEIFDNLTVIEWPGNLDVKFPDAIRIDIKFNKSNQRVFEICSCANVIEE